MYPRVRTKLLEQQNLEIRSWRISVTKFISTVELIPLLSGAHLAIPAGPIVSCNRQVSIIFIRGIEQFFFQTQVTLKAHLQDLLQS